MFLALIPEFSAAAQARIEANPAGADRVKRLLATLARLLPRCERENPEWAGVMRATLRRSPGTALRGLLDEIPQIVVMVRRSPKIFGPSEADRVDRILLLLNNACDDADADPEPYRLAVAYSDLLAAPAMRVAEELDEAEPRPVHYGPSGITSRPLPHQTALSNSILDEVNASCERAEAEGRHLSPAETQVAVDRGVRKWQAPRLARADRATVRSLPGGNGSSTGQIVRRPVGRGQHGHGARAPDGGSDDPDGGDDGAPVDRQPASSFLSRPPSPRSIPAPEGLS